MKNNRKENYNNHSNNNNTINDNYYTLLGVGQNATAKEVNKAYKKLALIYHPDKLSHDLDEAGKEAAQEKFVKITAAYDTLMNAESRAVYNEKLKISDITLEEKIINFEDQVRQIKRTKRIKSTSQPHSDKFKKLHHTYTQEFRVKPLTLGKASNFINYYVCDLYKDHDGNDCHNIFKFLCYKARHPELYANQDLEQIEKINFINPAVALILFLNFLKGKYYNKSLHQLMGYFDNAILSTKNEEEQKLYDGIQDILRISAFAIADANFKPNSDLLNAIQKITDYAKKDVHDSIIYITQLFQSKYYRNLYAFALHSYWFSEENAFDHEHLNAFNGEEIAKSLFEEAKEKLFNDAEGDSVNTVRFVRLLYKFEKNVHAHPQKNDKDLAEFYRQKAYLILDWIPALAGQVTEQMVANTVFQAGIYFQLAARFEKNVNKQMADEKLALQFYFDAYDLARKSSPDVALYICTHILKYILEFKYDFKGLDEIVKGLQNKTLMTANIYPCFDAIQPNTGFIKNSDSMLVLMRSVLHELLNNIQYNKNKKVNEKEIIIDHSYVNIFYEAYAACLQNWYEKKHNPEIEKEIRKKTMQEFLNSNRWTYEHIKQNITSYYINANRDANGWLDNSRSLAISAEKPLTYYRSVKGFKIDYNTGKIILLMEPAPASLNNNNQAQSSSNISLYDIYQLLSNTITNGFFSLDEVDSDLPYHPFYKMRIKPTRLVHTELQISMAKIDWLLKFLTVGSEVQAKEPFGTRSARELIKNLPAHLRKIFENYWEAAHIYRQNNTRRFSIHLEEIPFAVNNDRKTNDHIAIVSIGPVRMVVHTNTMVRDIKGDLVNLVNESEGWNMYVIDPSDLALRIKNIESPAMIWTGKTNTVQLYENGKLSDPIAIERYAPHIKRLFGLKRDTNNKVLLTDIQAIETVYRVTNEVAKQTGSNHYYSPDYILARELSIHFDELTPYFPELGRAKALCSAMILVRLLENKRIHNKDIIKDLHNKLDEKDTQFLAKIDAEINDNWGNLRKQILELNKGFSSTIIGNEIWAELQRINLNIKNDFDSIQSQKESALKNIEAKARQQNISFYDSKVQQIFQKQKEVFVKARDETYANFLNQLRQIFKEAPDNLLNEFLNNNLDPLYKYLFDQKINSTKEELKKIFPTFNINDIWNAVDDQGTESALLTIFNSLKNTRYEFVKNDIRKQLVLYENLDKEFNELGLTDEPKVNPDIDHICLWVPSSIYHEVNSNQVYTVYGGVNLSAYRLNQVVGGQAQALLQQAMQNTQIQSAHLVQQNRQIGNAFRDQVAGTIKAAMPNSEVRTEVFTKTPFGARYADIQVKQGDKIVHVETKVGNSPYEGTKQERKDIWKEVNYEIPTVVIRAKR